MSLKKYILLVLAIVVGILLAFFSGFYLKGIIKKDMIPYFSDEMVFITKDNPHYTLIIYSSRSPQNSTPFYTQRHKTFFYDGMYWQNQYANIQSTNLDITGSSIIPKWDVNIDPSRVLKQSVKGEAKVSGIIVKFEAPLLTNEMGIRSLPEYTQFKSETTGKLTVNGKEYESYVLLTRTYSYNASIDLIAINDTLGIKTDTVSIWDLDGNFYSTDETIVNDETKGPYKSHSIAVLKDKFGKIQKSFLLNTKKIEEKKYQIQIDGGIDINMDLNLLNSINKTNTNINWFTGQLDGEIELKDGKTIKGFGIYEQIY